MFLPIGDAPNPRGIAPVTIGLIVANVAVYVLVSLPLGATRPDPRDPAFHEYLEVMSQAVGERVPLQAIARQTSAYDLFVFSHGYRPAAPSLGDLFVCMFLHGGFMHLFGNMLFLWIYGDNVEGRLGALGYLFWYLLTGAAGTLSHALVFASSQMPLVGASGAISGVLGFYFVWFPRNQVRMLVFLPPFLMQVLQIPARIVLGLFLLADNLLPFLLSGAAGVAHGAHIGGFLAGAAAAWVMDRRRVAARPAGIGAPLKAGERPADAVRDALAEGRWEDAARVYFALPAPAARGLLDPTQAVELAGRLRSAGHPDAALAALRRVIRDTARAPGLAEAHALAGLILLEDLRQPTAAYQYLLSALELGPGPEATAATRRALATIEQLQKRSIGRLRTPPGW